MGDGGARITRIEMPDGTPVWARISGAEELEPPTGGLAYTDIGYTDIGYTDIRYTDVAERVQARVESLTGVVTSVARSLAEPLRAVRPDEVSVEFGIELTAKSGKVVGLLADGEAKGGIKVTLTWHGGGPPLDPPTVPPVPAQAPPPPPASPPSTPSPPPRPAGAPAGEPSAGAPPGAAAHPGGAPAPGGSGS